MTLTLELPEELEKAIETEANRRGVSAEQVALQMLQSLVESDKPRKVLKSYGIAAGNGRTVDDFLRERHEEAERDEVKTQERAARRASALRGLGIAAGSGWTVDDFLRERHEEAEREEASTQERLLQWHEREKQKNGAPES